MQVAPKLPHTHKFRSVCSLSGQHGYKFKRRTAHSRSDNATKTMANRWTDNSNNGKEAPLTPRTHNTHTHIHPQFGFAQGHNTLARPHQGTSYYTYMPKYSNQHEFHLYFSYVSKTTPAWWWAFCLLCDCLSHGAAIRAGVHCMAYVGLAQTKKKTEAVKCLNDLDIVNVIWISGIGHFLIGIPIHRHPHSDGEWCPAWSTATAGIAHTQTNIESVEVSWNSGRLKCHFLRPLTERTQKTEAGYKFHWGMSSS